MKFSISLCLIFVLLATVLSANDKFPTIVKSEPPYMPEFAAVNQSGTLLAQAIGGSFVDIIDLKSGNLMSRLDHRKSKFNHWPDSWTNYDFCFMNDSILVTLYFYESTYYFDFWNVYTEISDKSTEYKAGGYVLDFSAKDGNLVTKDQKRLVILDIDTGEMLHEVKFDTTLADVTVDHNRITSVTNAGEIYVHSLEGKELQYQLIEYQNKPVEYLSYPNIIKSPDGKYIAVSGLILEGWFNSALMIFNANDLSVKSVIEDIKYSSKKTGFSLDSKYLYYPSGNQSQSIARYDIQNNTHDHVFTSNGVRGVLEIAFADADDAAVYVTDGSSGKITKNGDEVPFTVPTYQYTYNIAANKAKGLLAVVTRIQTNMGLKYLFLDIDNFSVKHEVDHIKTANWIDFSPDRQKCIIPYNETGIRVLDMDDFSSILLENIHEEVINYATFQEDGSILSAGNDGAVKLTDYNTSESNVIIEHSNPVYYAGFHKNTLFMLDSAIQREKNNIALRLKLFDTVNKEITEGHVKFEPTWQQLRLNSYGFAYSKEKNSLFYLGSGRETLGLYDFNKDSTSNLGRAEEYGDWNSLSLTPSGNLLCTTGSKFVFIIDPETGAKIDSFYKYPTYGTPKNSDSVLNTGISPLAVITEDGKDLFIADSWGTISKFNILPVSVDENPLPQMKDELLVFPNPATGILHVNNPFLSASVLSVHNMQGQEVTSLTTDSKHITIDVSAYAPGVYLISLKNKDQTINQKIVINK